MPSNLKKLGSAALSAVLVLCWSSATFGAGAGAGSTTLHGHVPPQIRGATRLGRVASDENVPLTLVVRIDEALMAKTLAEIYGPGAPAQKRYLSNAEFAAKFDLAAKRQKIKDFAAASGLAVDAASDDPGSLVVKAAGPASRVEKAFGVQLYRYRGAGGQVFRAHESDPSVPADLAPHIGAVLGLSNFRGGHKPRLARSGRHVTAAQTAGAAPSHASPSAVLTGGGGPACYTDDTSECGMNPAAIEKVYGLTGTSLTGSGQTVALLELDGYATTGNVGYSDIGLYETNSHIFSQPGPNPTITCLSQDGACYGCGPNQSDPCNAATLAGSQSDEGGTGDDGMIEVALDIEMVIALAPAANILVYTAQQYDSDLLAAYAKIASDNTASVASTSWGADEETTGGAFMASENTVFEQMAVHGQTMFAAAGDRGAYDSSGNDQCGTNGDQACSYNAHLLTDDPASQTYVTAVGGTSLTGTPSSFVEAVWNEGCSGSNPGVNCDANGAGGGGVANYCENASGPLTCPSSGVLPAGTTAYWTLPSYQMQTNGSALAGLYSSAYRNLPDVSLNADPNTSPYSICVGDTCISDNTLIGGTSAASPLWAALTALINQQRVAGTEKYVYMGFANPPIYQLATSGSYGADFNDITANNQSGYAGNGYYSVAVGYDNATGWGSFKGNAFISSLATPLPSNQYVSGGTANVLGTSSVTYSWTPVAGLSYNVYTTTTSPYVLSAVNIQPPYVQTGLTGDETCGVQVYNVTDGVQGTNPATIPTATLAAAPAGVPAATGWSSSATFTFPSLQCPASPDPSACSGYKIQVSPNSSFTGTVFSSSTPSRTLTTLSVTGLSSLTNYYMRLGTLNSLGAASYGPTGGVNTGTNLVAPVLASPPFSQVTTNSMIFNWGANGNPYPQTNYLVEASTASNMSGTLLTQSGTALSANFTGLTSDTSYYFQVAGLGGPALNAGPEATLAAEPVALPNAFSSVGSSGFVASWSAGSDQPDTLYQVDVSLSSNFSPVAASLQTRVPSATFAGLAANTPYYARVEAIGRAGSPTSFLSLGSTTTLVNPPTLPVQPFSAQTASGFTFAFNQTNSPGTRYLVQIATSPAFTTVVGAATTTSASAAFSGLLSNQLYYAEVASLNQYGSLSSFAAASTATAVEAPTAVGIPVSAVTATTLSLQWAPGTLAAGTTYQALLSLSPAYSPSAASSVTLNAYAIVGSLQPNTTYYGEVQALSLEANPDGPFLPFPAAATLANAPTAAAAPFQLVSYTSAVVAWNALPLMPQSSAAEGYVVQFDTMSDFSGLVFSSTAPPGAASAAVTGLSYATQYYARVGALNWEDQPDFLSLGSTVTAQPALSSGTVGGTGITLTVPQTFPQLTAVSVIVPPSAFPSGTPISAVANLASLPPSVTNEAASIVPFGSNVGIVLNASGLQPNAPVTISMAYDFTQIPPGQSEARLQLWRYDPIAGQWTLVPSQVDTVGHVLTAQTQHFSTFSPFFVAAAADVSSVQVWPQPWEIGDATSQYFANTLSFSNLPGGASVKIFSVLGELVWSATAAADGTLNWNGDNRYGRRVASGTYYIAFQSGGQTRTRRLVIIR